MSTLLTTAVLIRINIAAMIAAPFSLVIQQIWEGRVGSRPPPLLVFLMLHKVHDSCSKKTYKQTYNTKPISTN